MMKRLVVCTAVLIGSVCLFAQDDGESIHSVNDEGSMNSVPAATPAPARRAVTQPSRTVAPRSMPASRAAAQSQDDESPAASTGGDDDQFIQDDDYFISDVAFATQEWIWVSIAKMTTAASATTKREAEFFKIRDGSKIWTKYYYKTVIARKSDLKLGTVIIGFNDNTEEGVYKSPESKESSRGGSWFVGKVNDLSDLHKGYVTIAGNYKIDLKNLRVVSK